MITTAILVIAVNYHHQGNIKDKTLDCNLILCSDGKNKALFLKGTQ